MKKDTLEITKRYAEIREIDIETNNCILCHGIHTGTESGGPFEKFATLQIRAKNPLKGMGYKGKPRNLIAVVTVSETDIRAILEHMTT
jgi:hypothetical protein